MASIQHTRDGVNLTSKIQLSYVATEAADLIRGYLASWTIQQGDVILVGGTADFGPDLALVLPSCTYRGIAGRTARWLTRCKIDAKIINSVEVKPSSTGGFDCGSFTRFENFYLGGECFDTEEDGGLISYEKTNTGHCVLEFDNCEIDASRGFDWGIYSWVPYARTLTMTDCVFRYCRIGVAFAVNTGPNSTANLTRVAFYGDANKSKSFAETSQLADDINCVGIENCGGLMTPALNRDGTINMTDCSSEIIGERERYNSAWGVPRIAGLCTNNYATAQATGCVANITRCSVDYTPGLESMYNDIDMRNSPVVNITYDETAVAQAQALADKWLLAAQDHGAEAISQAVALGNKWVAHARGGSASDGTFSQWAA